MDKESRETPGPGGGHQKTPIMQAALLPGMVPDEELRVLWRQSIAPYFDAQQIAPDAAGRPPQIRQYSLGSVLLADSRFSAQTYDRDRHWMRRYDDADHLLLQVFVEGRNLAINGTDEYVQAPGNVCAINLAYEAKSQSTDGRALTLVLPRDLVRHSLPHLIDARGALLAPDSAAARVLSDYLLSLGENLARATQDEAPALIRATVGLIDALTAGNDVASHLAQSATLDSACRYIEAHLADPGLGVGAICRYLRCSRATLYRLFSGHGGIQDYIRRRRLVACFKAIGSPRQAHRRIYDIALDFGFTSPSHFSHLFRAHFGMTPREARELEFNAAPLPPGPGTNASSGAQAVEQIWRWARTLAERS
jgi:AraC-like DNA-binding protein